MSRLIGCLVMLGVLGLCAVLATYFFVVRPARVVGAQLQEAAEAFREIRTLEEEVENTAPFEPGEEEELSASQLERFVAVQDAVSSSARADFDALEAKYRELKALGDGGVSKALANPRALAMVVDDFVTALGNAKRVQVDALNAQEFSISEYRWTQREALAALGVSVLPAPIVAARDLDIETLRTLGGRLAGEVEDVPVDDAPDAAEVVVSQHRDRLDDWVTAAALGL
jgi:hypothetical protein